MSSNIVASVRAMISSSSVLRLCSSVLEGSDSSPDCTVSSCEDGKRVSLVDSAQEVCRREQLYLELIFFHLASEHGDLARHFGLICRNNLGLGWLAESFTPSQCSTSYNRHVAVDEFFATCCLDCNLGYGGCKCVDQSSLLTYSFDYDSCTPGSRDCIAPPWNVVGFHQNQNVSKEGIDIH